MRMDAASTATVRCMTALAQSSILVTNFGKTRNDRCDCGFVPASSAVQRTEDFQHRLDALLAVRLERTDLHKLNAV